MKRTLIAVTAGFFAFQMNGQQYYGETALLHATPTQLTTGKYLTGISNNTGFLLGGNNPLSPIPTGDPNFYIDVVNQNVNTVNFQNEYLLYGDNFCSTSPAQAITSKGVSAIEINVGFALAATTEDGCFFATTNNSGAISTSGFYTFPTGSYNVSKPVIVEGNGRYFITGSFECFSTPFNICRQMYILSVSPSGSLLQSNVYNMSIPCGASGCACGSNFGRELTPNDMIFSSFTQELIIVGAAHIFGPQPNIGCMTVLDTQGFLLKVNPNNLSTVSIALYDQFSTANPLIGINKFNSISESTQQTYVIGGSTDINTSQDQAWVLRVNSSTGQIYDSKILYPNLIYQFVGTLLETTSIKERYSPIFGTGYYAAIKMNPTNPPIFNQALVVRLDANLEPFVAPSGFPLDDYNEFFLSSQNNGTDARALTLEPANSVFNEGFHVYGQGTMPDEHFLGLCPFNGEPASLSCFSGSYHDNLLTFSTGPTNFNTTNAINTLSGISQCNNHLITVNTPNNTFNSICSTSSLPTNGSNNKPVFLQESKSESNVATIFPNPSTGTFTIKNLPEKETLNITVEDVSGKEVYSNVAYFRETGSEISLKLEKGIYFLYVKGKNITASKSKLIITE